MYNMKNKFNTLCYRKILGDVSWRLSSECVLSSEEKAINMITTVDDQLENIKHNIHDIMNVYNLSQNRINFDVICLNNNCYIIRIYNELYLIGNYMDCKKYIEYIKNRIYT
jgi:hypothetical protein